MQHIKAGFYIRDVVCLLGGTNWVFKYYFRFNSIFKRWNQVLHTDMNNGKFIFVHVMKLFVL